jgi:hypothetical protein
MTLGVVGAIVIGADGFAITALKAWEPKSFSVQRAMLKPGMRLTSG